MSSESAKKHKPRETVFDVDAEQLARIYAKAALDAAGDSAAQDLMMEELDAIVDEVLNKYPDIEQVFSSALISQEDKQGILDRIFGSRLSSSTLSFLKVLSDHGRLGALRDVVRSARELWNHRSGREPVELQVAQKLDESLHQEVIDSLQKILGINPVVTTVVNPDLIAGFVVRIGDKVYDASTRASFERVRQSMVAHAVEAIQQHPQQFIDKSS
ncbi:MAG: ATP synthase F1 subunit delta [Planctomycetes bacterium]|nr:ATP synthase F1 subunit delta [Planctomycetota bacterium]